MKKTNEIKSYLYEYSQAISELYIAIQNSNDEKEIIDAYGKYFIKLDIIHKQIVKYIDDNHSLVLSKCWKTSIIEYFYEIAKHNAEEKEKADVVLAKYDSEEISNISKRCVELTAEYSADIFKKYQYIYLANYIDLKDPYSIIYERKSDGFVDIIFENDCIRYIGYMKNGKFHGKGKLFSKAGVSEGTWFNGKENGLFVYTDNDGTILKGTMIDGKLEGDVVTIWKDGDIIKHKYKNGICLDDEDNK
jgi:hypothetical protein